MCPVAGNGVGSPSARSAASDPDTQLQSVAFNPRLRNTVAFSDSNGNVKVWKLTWKLSNMKPGEERRLRQLADIATVRTSPKRPQQGVCVLRLIFSDLQLCN